MTESFRPVAPAEPVAAGGAARPLALPRRAIPTVSGLIAFEATARQGSFSRAAAELDLSQGAVSKRVRQLEEVLGTPLLRRDHHRIALTPAGRAYLSRATRVLAELETAAEALAPRCAAAGELAVAVSPGHAAHWLVPRLARFRRRHPGITVNLAARPAAADPAREGLDAAVACVPGAEARREGVSALFDEWLLPVATPAFAAEHGLADAAALAAAPRLDLAGRPDLWEMWFARAGLADSAPPAVARHDGLALLCAAARAGLGAALLPPAMAGTQGQGGLLAVAAPVAVQSGRTMILATAGAGREGAAAAFRRWVCAEAAAERDGPSAPAEFSGGHSMK